MRIVDKLKFKDLLDCMIKLKTAESIDFELNYNVLLTYDRCLKNITTSDSSTVLQTHLTYYSNNVKLMGLYIFMSK